MSVDKEQATQRIVQKGEGKEGRALGRFLFPPKTNLTMRHNTQPTNQPTNTFSSTIHSHWGSPRKEALEYYLAKMTQQNKGGYLCVPKGWMPPLAQLVLCNIHNTKTCTNGKMRFFFFFFFFTNFPPQFTASESHTYMAKMVFNSRYHFLWPFIPQQYNRA